MCTFQGTAVDEMSPWLTLKERGDEAVPTPVIFRAPGGQKLRNGYWLPSTAGQSADDQEGLRARYYGFR